jgi:hypothetical protein
VLISANPVDRQAFAKIYIPLLDSVAPVDAAVATAAVILRDTATTRIATVDILIPATAKVHGATLGHRDSHFAAIAPEQVPSFRCRKSDRPTPPKSSHALTWACAIESARLHAWALHVLVLRRRRP